MLFPPSPVLQTVGKMYIEREAKRARQAQLGPGAWESVGTPGALAGRLSAPERTRRKYKGSGGLNGSHPWWPPSAGAQQGG